MNVRDIVIAHLKDIGADGLAGEDCGCGLDDLMPCEHDSMADCKPARKIICKDDGFTHCEDCITDCRPHEKETAVIYITATAKDEETHL